MLNRFVAILVLLVASGTVRAEIVDLTWTGVTALGNDGLGLFGSAGGTIAAGTPYVATYRYDTTVSFIENGTNGSQEVTGGSFFDPDRAVPLISSSITVNGMKVDVDGNFDSSYFRQSGQGSSNLSALAQRQLNNPQPSGGELFQRVFRSGNFYGGPVLAQPGDFNFDANDNPGGNFSFLTRDGSGNITGSTGFGIIPNHLSITVVPEPATGILSLVAASLVLRRRGK